MERSDDRPSAAYRVVLLHGHGDGPASMAPIAESLRQRTGATVVAPAGPHRLPASGGTDARAWWPDDAEGPDGETIAGVLAAAAPDDSTATNEPIAFVGFSQGGAMALAAAAAHQRGVHDARRATTGGAGVAVAVVSGFLPGDGAVPEGAAVLVVHGLDDTVVDPFHGELVARRCRRNDCVVDEQHHDGGHTWDDAITALVARWLLH